MRSACPEDNVEIFRPTDFLSFAGPKGYNLGGLGGLPSGGLRGMMACARLLFNCEHPRIVIEYGPVIGKFKNKEERKREAITFSNLSHICHILSVSLFLFFFLTSLVFV